MYLMRMIVTSAGTEDGRCVRYYEAGGIYLLPMLLALRFVTMRAAKQLF